MSKTIQPRLGTVVTMIVAVLFLFLLFSQAGKYHESGFIVEKAEERLALNKERKKAMLYIGVSDDVALKLQPIKIPLTVKKNEEKRTIKTLSRQIDDPNIEAALSYATQINSQKVNNTNKPLKRSQYTVRRGDTLFGIAQKVYGDGNKWRQILKHNSKLTKPSQLRSGMKLTIPEPTSNNTAYIKWQQSDKKKS